MVLRLVECEMRAFDAAFSCLLMMLAIYNRGLGLRASHALLRLPLGAFPVADMGAKCAASSRMTSMYWSVQAPSKLCSLPSDAGSV